MVEVVRFQRGVHANFLSDVRKKVALLGGEGFAGAGFLERGETLALWTLHTHAFQLRGVSTYLGIESPEKRCGKTTLLTVLSELVNRPVVSSDISSPAFFRVIKETLPTLLREGGKP